MKKHIKIDNLTELKPLNRYLLFVKTTFFEKRLSYKKVKGKYLHYQKVKSIKKNYAIQWQNIRRDFISLFENPLAVAPRIAYSLLAFYFIFLGKHDDAFKTAFVIGAITMDGTVTSFEYSTSSASVTVASNSDRLMVVSYGSYQGGGPSAVSYNSVGLTSLVSQVGSFNEVCSIWGLLAPDTGSHTLSVSSMGNWSAVGIYSLYNVDQTLPATTTKTGGSGSGTSLALTTTVDNAWVLTCIEAEPTITHTTSGYANNWAQQGASYQNAGGHTVVKATAGSQTMTSSLSYGARWNQCNIQIKPVAAASGPANLKTKNALAKASIKTMNGLAIASVKSVNGLT